VWDATTGHLLVKLAGWVMHAAFSSDGERIVTASGDKTARVWNAANGQLLAKLEGHTDHVMHAAFSPDGQRIVTASYDKTARVYRILTLSDIAELLSK
jgi:WD40 repeat protein